MLKAPPAVLHRDPAGRSTPDVRSRRRFPVNPYLVAVLGTAAVAGIRLLLEPWLRGQAPMILFTVAVLVAAQSGGLKPGLLATALSILVGSYLFVGREYVWWPAAGPEGARMLVFALAGVLISTFTERLRRAMRRQDEAEERLRRYELLANNTQDIMLFVDADSGRILEANAAATAAYGYGRDELLALTIYDLRSVATRGLTARQMAAVDRDGVEFETEHRRKDGSCFPVDVRSHGASLNGARILLSVVRDITDRKRAEDALRESDRRKDEFIAILSHELRNPLAPIRYALPLVQREPLSPTGARAAEVIDRQVDHLTRLVDDLLDVSRISRDKIELRRETVTLGDVVAAGADASSPAIHAARHTLRLDIPEEPIWLHADPARLSQVVTNLLNNSARYTPRGGQILLEARLVGQQAVIRVRDNGIGIPSDALPTIFNMFQQVNRPDSSQGGLGIGLALVKRLVEMHGGAVEVNSLGVGEGAEFVVRLPVADVAAARPDSPATAQGPSSERLKVLVVDDNADLVEMLALLVEAAGHDVRKALDGRSAVSAALAYRPDVVLLDLGLPVMNGLEVARELRSRPETASARLVALTGWGQAEDRRHTEEAGFDRHLTKPADPETLNQLLLEFGRGTRA